MSLADGAAAQPSPTPTPATQEGDAANAVEVGRKALEHFERGELEAARSLFASAERLAHSPVFQLYEARCLRDTGRLVAARDLLARVAAEVPGGEAPPPWAHAVALAKEELAAVERRIPTVCVTSRDFPEAVGASLDGTPVPLALEGKCSGIAVDPGEHTVVVWDQAGSATTLPLVVKEGQRNVSPTPPVLPLQPLPPQDRNVTAAPPAPLAEGPSTQKLMGYAALGLGLLGLAAGGVTGIVAASRTGNLDCTDDVCPRTEQARVNDAKRWATAATLSFVVGGLFSATGVVVLLTAPERNGGTAGWVGVSGGF